MYRGLRQCKELSEIAGDAVERSTLDPDCSISAGPPARERARICWRYSRRSEALWRPAVNLYLLSQNGTAHFGDDNLAEGCSVYGNCEPGRCRVSDTKRTSLEKGAGVARE
jgi:hypothetical protein